MDDEIEFKEFIKRVVDNSGGRISQCEMFTALVTDNFLNNPQCVLEVGLAVLLDKPISLIVVKGTRLPENLKKIAYVIETVNDTSEQEMNRVIKNISKSTSEMFDN